MPKMIGRRRFDDPRYGVSEAMVEAESRELGRELDSYLLQSLTELKENSDARLRVYREQDQSLRVAITGLPERERLAMMCILGRDLILVQAVFAAFLQRQNLPPAKVGTEAAPPAPLPFSEWLFAK